MPRLNPALTTAAGLLLAVLGLGLTLSAVSCSDANSDKPADHTDGTEQATARVAQQAESGYIGAAACAACHQQQHDDWVGSHHEQAMKPATPETVLGDFDDATFEHSGVTTRFFTKDGRYFVHTDGPDGRLADFEIAYTFGVAPLQQYLVRFPGGKVQALTIAWDARPEDAGGQRWYHLYPDETIPHTDALHWTGPNFTWNHMCAECHSTGLQKHYDESTKTYRTRWEEINVSCEACHGSGRAHADWAEQYGLGAADKAGGMGLVVQLKDETRLWDMNPETGIAERRTPLEDDTLINACARCHSRRSQIADGPDAGAAFLDHYRPAHLTEGLYLPDGQIQDEVYVWGSFVQSKMHLKGVTCVDCHDPHAANVPTTTNDLCTQCHLPAKFDTPAHHFHEAGSAGASCIDCHMPHRTYMGVDDRRDHSLRVPRPDLSVKLGTPNACTQCHTDQDAPWAADAAARWWGVDVDRPVHYGEVFATARAGEAGADKALLAILRDAAQPAIVRGTAVTLLAGYPTRAAAEGVLEALASDEPLVRVAAADALGNMPITMRARPALQLLDDPLFAVRIEAGEALADVPPERIGEHIRDKVRAGIDGYRRAQRVSADTAAANMNLGNLALRLGDRDQARRRFEVAIEINPTFIPAYVNLASLLSDQGQAMALLERGLALQPGNADLLQAKALTHIRMGDRDRGVSELERAHEAAPGRIDIAYVYAIALHDTGNPSRAVTVLGQALETAPNDLPALVALSQYHAELGQFDAALTVARRAQKLVPEDAGIAQLVTQLEARQP